MHSELQSDATLTAGRQRAQITGLDPRILFCVAVLGAFQVKLAGTITLAEVALPLLAIRYLHCTHLDGRLLALGIAYALQQLLASILAGDSAGLAAVGLARILLLLVVVVAIQALAISYRHLAALALGWALSQAIQAVLIGDLSWKSGLGFPILVLLSTFRHVLWLSASTAMSFLLGARSLAGIAGIAAFLFRYRGRRTGLVLGAAAVSALLLVALYSAAAPRGYLGDAALEKYELQTGALGPIIGARQEVFFVAPALARRPLLGYGARPSQDTEIEDAAIAELQSLGYDVSRARSTQGVLRTHSLFFGAWVSAGLLGALFYACAGVRLLRASSRLTNTATPLAALFTSAALFHLLFSPYSTGLRFLLGIALAGAHLATRPQDAS